MYVGGSTVLLLMTDILIKCYNNVISAKLNTIINLIIEHMLTTYDNGNIWSIFWKWSSSNINLIYFPLQRKLLNNYFFG